MAKIIKQTDPGSSAYPLYERTTLEAFVFSEEEPLADEAVDAEIETEEAIRIRAEEEAAEILAQAREEAAEKIQLAYQEGFRRGQEAGRQAYLDEVRTGIQAIQRMGEELSLSKVALLGQLEEGVSSLAEAVSGRILHREAWADRAAVRRIVKAVLEHIAGSQRVMVRLNPRDAEALEREAKEFFEQMEHEHHVRLRADESIEPGGCVVETEDIYVDARFPVTAYAGCPHGHTLCTS